MTVACIQGHRPTKIFIITTSGRVDRYMARLVLWASVHTWGRWTRWLPQNLVTIAALVYFAAGLSQIVMVHQWRGLLGAFNVFVLSAVCAFLEWKSHRLRGLSGHMRMMDIRIVAEARSTAGIRPVAVLLAAYFLTTSAVDFTTADAFTDVAMLAWLWALYTVTMGRTLPPKKARRHLHLPHMPRLPRLAPAPSP